MKKYTNRHPVVLIHFSVFHPFLFHIGKKYENNFFFILTYFNTWFNVMFDEFRLMICPEHIGFEQNDSFSEKNRKVKTKNKSTKARSKNVFKWKRQFVCIVTWEITCLVKQTNFILKLYIKHIPKIFREPFLMVFFHLFSTFIST